MVVFAGCLVIVAVIYAIARGIDVRLVLVLAGLALGLIVGAGNLWVAAGVGGSQPFSELARVFFSPVARVTRTFLVTFSNEQFVLPICTAMGFAYALRETHCDEHLVHLLIRPLRHARLLFLPGIVLVGFVVNIPLISQCSTAVVAGTVLVPLARAAGIAPSVVAAALVLGASIGGELLNPGAAEMQTVIAALHDKGVMVQPSDCLAQIRPLLWCHLLTTTLAFWLLNLRSTRATEETPAAQPTASDSSATVSRIEPATVSRIEPAAVPRINLLKAAVPFIPLALLLALAPPFQLWSVPVEWLVVDPTSHVELKAANGRLIGAAMLIGTAVAALTTPGAIGGLAKAFFSGAAYAFLHVVSLIICANTFGEGVRLLGADALLGSAVQSFPRLLLPLAAGLPWLFAVLCGSGIASTQSLYRLFVAPSEAAGIDPLQTGALVSMGAAAGRTMSPVSAVALMGAKLTDTSPLAISRRLGPPLLIGMIATLVYAMFRSS